MKAIDAVTEFRVVDLNLARSFCVISKYADSAKHRN